MTMTEKLEQTLEWFGDILKRADSNRHNSHGMAPNSYGAGYDQGFYDGLREALAQITMVDDDHKERLIGRGGASTCKLTASHEAG